MRRRIRKISAIIGIIVALISLGLSNKSEVFECNLSKNTCSITATNYFNIKKIRPMPAPKEYRDIQIQHTTEFVSKNRRHGYSSGHYEDRYYLYYETMDGQQGRFFSKRFHYESDATAVKEGIKRAFRNAKDEIHYEL